MPLTIKHMVYDSLDTYKCIKTLDLYRSGFMRERVYGNGFMVMVMV